MRHLREERLEMSEDDIRTFVLRKEPTVCPVCHSGIEMPAVCLEPFLCPFCTTSLKHGAVEVVGHFDWHLDPTITPPEPGDILALGELCTIEYPANMTLCETCGEVYPPGYSCCPGLLKHAIWIYPEYRKTGKLEVVFAFLRRHQATLLAAYPKRIMPSLGRKQNKSLKLIAEELGISQQLEQLARLA